MRDGLERVDQPGAQLVAFGHPDALVEVLRLVVVPSERDDGVRRQLQPEARSRDGSVGRDGARERRQLPPLAHRRQLGARDLLAPHRGHHHLVRGKVQVFVPDHRVPRLAEGDDEAVGGDVAAVGDGAQGIAPVRIRETAVQGVSLLDELIVRVLVVREGGELEGEEVVERSARVFGRFGHRLPDGLQVRSHVSHQRVHRGLGRLVADHEQERGLLRVKYLEYHLEDGLQEGFARGVLSADVVAPYVDQQGIRGGHREKRGLLLELGVVLAALAPVRALQVHDQRRAVRVVFRGLGEPDPFGGLRPAARFVHHLKVGAEDVVHERALARALGAHDGDHLVLG